MQVKKLLKLLEQSRPLSPEDIQALEVLIEEYPYFYLAHALLAKGVYVEEKDAAKHTVQRAAIYAIDRSYLRKWLEHKLDLSHVRQKSRIKSAQAVPVTANNYLEMIAKRSLKMSTNATSIQQFAVIDAALNKNLQFDPFIETALHKEEVTMDLTESGASVDHRFATETLAAILVQQKKYKRAIEIYEQLMVRYPEKKSYLQDIVSRLIKEF